MAKPPSSAPPAISSEQAPLPEQSGAMSYRRASADPLLKSSGSGSTATRKRTEIHSPLGASASSVGSPSAASVTSSDAPDVVVVLASVVVVLASAGLAAFASSPPLEPQP